MIATDSWAFLSFEFLCRLASAPVCRVNATDFVSEHQTLSAYCSLKYRGNSRSLHRWTVSTAFGQRPDLETYKISGDNTSSTYITSIADVVLNMSVLRFHFQLHFDIVEPSHFNFSWTSDAISIVCEYNYFCCAILVLFPLNYLCIPIYTVSFNPFHLGRTHASSIIRRREFTAWLSSRLQPTVY